MLVVVILALLLAAPVSHGDDTKFSDLRLNAFATEYNGFVEKLKSGHLDLKKWKRVVKKWNDIEQCPQCPDCGREEDTKNVERQ